PRGTRAAGYLRARPRRPKRPPPAPRGRRAGRRVDGLTPAGFPTTPGPNGRPGGTGPGFASADSGPRVWVPSSALRLAARLPEPPCRPPTRGRIRARHPPTRGGSRGALRPPPPRGADDPRTRSPRSRARWLWRLRHPPPRPRAVSRSAP